MPTEKLTKVNSDERITDNVLINLPENYLQALARLADTEVEEALKAYIGLREMSLAKSMGRLSSVPDSKSWGTLFQLQDLQSKLTELIKIVNLPAKANRILNKKKDNKKQIDS